MTRGAKRLGGKRPGRKRLGGETTRGGNGLGAKRLGFFSKLASAKIDPWEECGDRQDCRPS